jgi:hypothetical protein
MIDDGTFSPSFMKKNKKVWALQILNKSSYVQTDQPTHAACLREREKSWLRIWLRLGGGGGSSGFAKQNMSESDHLYGRSQLLVSSTERERAWVSYELCFRI